MVKLCLKAARPWLGKIINKGLGCVLHPPLFVLYLARGAGLECVIYAYHWRCYNLQSLFLAPDDEMMVNMTCESSAENLSKFFSLRGKQRREVNNLL